MVPVWHPVCTRCSHLVTDGESQSVETLTSPQWKSDKYSPGTKSKWQAFPGKRCTKYWLEAQLPQRYSAGRWVWLITASDRIGPHRLAHYKLGRHKSSIRPRSSVAYMSPTVSKTV